MPDLSVVRVPAANIIGMLVSTAISVLLPIVLMIIWRVKTKAKLIWAVVGMGTFIVVVIIAESFVNNLVCIGTGMVNISGEVLKPVAYCIYGGCAAGLFEELGRFFAMKIFKSRVVDKKNSIMYGIGHGGFEAMFLVGTAMISNFAITAVINSGQGHTLLKAVPNEMRDALYQQISPLWTSAPSDFYAGGVERIGAIALHICLSYIVYLAISKNDLKYLLLAFLIHALVDFLTVYAATIWKLGTWEIEIGLLVLVGIIAYFVINAYKKDLNYLEG